MSADPSPAGVRRPAECFIYQLRPGCAEEYEKHHARVWPEVITALRGTGITEYTIYRRDDLVISVLRREAEPASGELPPAARARVEEWDALMAPLFLESADAQGVPLFATPIFDLGEAQYAEDAITLAP